MSVERDTSLPPYAVALGYGGLVPFVACAVAMLAIPGAETRQLAGQALTGYGAVILSFLGGVHWGLVMRAATPCGATMLIAGVVPSLVGLTTLMLPFETAAALQVGAFGGFWLYEHRVLGRAVLPPAYLAMRRWLTVGVVASLGFALMAPSL